MTSDGDAERPPLELSSVTIGVLTALNEEYAACRDVFDPRQGGKEQHRRATSGELTCWVCSIPARHGGYHVVAISLLPDMGNIAAAVAANILLQHCPAIRHLIMCGVAGAVPHPSVGKDHVRLGDIVVSDQDGVIQYDRGKQRDPRKAKQSARESSDGMVSVPDPFAGFEFRGSPRSPSTDLLQAVRRIHVEEERLGRRALRDWELKIRDFLKRIGDARKWKRPGPKTDLLIDSADGQGPCIPHPKSDRRRGWPQVFHGPIGAANIVQADPARRDALRDSRGIKAVEMEGCGIADASWVAGVGYLVVRGTCDYCNSTKNDGWHHYAALIAAAYVCTIVEYLHPVPPAPSGASNAELPPNPILPLLNDLTSGPGKPSNPTASTAEPGNPRSNRSFGGESTAATEKRLSVSIIEPTAASKGVDIVENEAPLSPAAVRNVAAEAQIRPVDGAGINAIEGLVLKIETLLKEYRFSETDPFAAELERQLRFGPREGRQVRAGWIVLLRMEIRRLTAEKQAGRPLDLTRLHMLQREAGNVVD